MHLLHAQERREPAVLDGAGGDVAAGQELRALDHGLVHPTGPGRRHQQQIGAVERPGPLQLLQRQLGPACRVQRLGVVAHEHPDGRGFGRLLQHLAR